MPLQRNAARRSRSSSGHEAAGVSLRRAGTIQQTGLFVFVQVAS